MSNAITITEVEHEGMTFDLATQKLGNGDTAYWLIHEGALVVADQADETSAAEVVTEMAADWIHFIDLPKVETNEQADYYEMADWYYDSRF